ncbi:hypothetical protein Pla175_34390 [Pirellulimonas nuda]|uniref:AAA+ ATPase domain-containing protein n=1 Tax=Pirellulimonas nuda TaxID=2528009 RepID=A0A518DF10_9BACT|nr:hypothetical protein [Pirellulimonas nuda]QDU90040.1 hypothetical protein Pla175_34390 [Pirellulimonas nuda]
MNTISIAPRDADVPSRFSNPFATCWTRPGALTPILPDGLSIEDLVERLRSNAWRGEIVGPHGSGKSTLLAALAPVARSAAGGELTIIDGLDEASWLSRRLLVRPKCRLLATTHVGAGLPTLCRMAPALDQLRELYQRLTTDRENSTTLADAYDHYDRCQGNIREVWFALYLLHERRSRGAGGASVSCLQRRSRGRAVRLTPTQEAT